MTDPLTVAVVTGGHSYDVKGFRRLWRELPGIDAYVQHLDDFCCTPAKERAAYDAVVFFTMLEPTPTDEGLPWFQGKPRAVQQALGEDGVGIVVLHHAILNDRTGELWGDITGVRSQADFGYHIGEEVTYRIADPDHPITAGIDEWTMVDETYTMPEPDGGSHLLVTTDHDPSMRAIAWTRTRKRSKVFCFQCGHDERAWSDATFREILCRGIAWSAGR